MMHGGCRLAATSVPHCQLEAAGCWQNLKRDRVRGLCWLDAATLPSVLPPQPDHHDDGCCHCCRHCEARSCRELEATPPRSTPRWRPDGCGLAPARAPTSWRKTRAAEEAGAARSNAVFPLRLSARKSARNATRIRTLANAPVAAALR